MTRCFSRIGLVALLALGALGSPVNGEPIVAGSTVLLGRAIQDITLSPNTLFNPTSTPIFIPGVYGDGEITINRDAQVGSTITIASLSGGMFYGSNPMLGNYVFGNVPPLTGADFSGVITNVVQNPSDPGYATGQPSSFASGDFSFGGASFGFQLIGGPTLFTDPSVPFSFSATFDGLPPSAGTILMNSGPDSLNVLLGTEIVATSSNRRIEILSPEPSTLVVTGIAALSACCLLRRRSGRA